MKPTTKPRAVLNLDKAMVELLTRRVKDFRETAKLKDKEGYVRGLGSYALYGIKHSAGQLVVLASEPTSSDFNQYVTAKAKADACSRYDHVIEYRDVGSYKSPKVTILVWELEETSNA
jgi:hypothetical protein